MRREYYIASDQERVPSSDEEWLRRCRQGDESAWEEVVANYKRLVYSIPLNFGLTADEAADIFQQTFISLLENLERLRPDSNLAAWLATVARRHALHQLRKRKREQLGANEDLSENIQLQAIMAADVTVDLELLQTINQGLDQIGRRCRELLLALYFDARQPSYEEIARQMNVPVGSIGPTRGRCLERLKQALSDK
jgi:RNA polymerase sigma factor (sigma-70 family)